MGIVAQQGAVLERSGFTLGAVGHHKPRADIGTAFEQRLPFDTDGESGTAAAPQSGCSKLTSHLVGQHRTRGLQTSQSARRLILGE